MTLVTEYPEHRQELEVLLNSLEGVIDSATARVCKEHYSVKPHESIMTGRLIQEIESEVRAAQFDLPGLSLEVLAQSFSAVAEKRVGADLYISLARLDVESPKTKGMLVQVKWDHALNESNEWRRLRNQSTRMLRRSRESETWILTPTNVRTVDAQKTANQHRPNNLFNSAETPGVAIADGLRCCRGDEEIGRSLDADPREAIAQAMRELDVPHSIGFTVR